MVTTLAGSNGFGLKRELRRIIDAFVKEYGDLGLEQLDGDEASFERLQEALTSLPFLASKKLVVLRTPGANKKFAEAFESLLKGLPETTDVIIVEPKLDKRLSYYKQLKKLTDFREFGPLDVRQLALWLSSEAKERGGTLSAPDAQYLAERAGSDQQLLANELDKLLLYSPHITRETIDLLTEATPQSTTFQLLEAAFAGNAKRTMQLYAEQRALGEEPQKIIGLLAWQLHVLALVKTAGERSAQAVAGEAKISPYTVQKSQAIARRLSLAELKQLIHSLYVMDIRSKRTALDVDEALQNYLLNMALQ